MKEKNARMSVIVVATCPCACSAEHEGEGSDGERWGAMGSGEPGGAAALLEDEPEDTEGMGAAPWEDEDDIPADWDEAEVEGGTVNCAQVVATLVRDTGSSLVFCVTDDDDDSWSMIEIGHLDDLGTPVDPSGKCAADVFAEEAPGEPVPQVLLDICGEFQEPDGGEMQERKMNELIAGGQPAHGSDPAGDILGPPRTMRSHYCSANGYAEFFDEICVTRYWNCIGPDQCFCQPGLVTWHQRTSNNKAWYADETQAACTQFDRMRRFRRRNVSPYNWLTEIDVTIAPNYWARHTWTAGWIHYYQRYRGDSNAGGHHRYAGFFNY